MSLIKSVLALTGAAALVNAAPLDDLSRRQSLPPSATSAPYPNTAAQSQGKLWFGSAIDTTGSEYTDKEYMTIFNDSQIFGQTTPGNTMKWEFVEPEQNQFDFAPGQITINLAQATGKKVRCHNLCWSSELPSWITSGSWTNATLTAALQNHVTKVIEHWGNACYSWDVVNEALQDDGTFTSNVFLTTIGEAYVPIAFMAATEAVKANNLDVKLFYNDYNIEYPGTKASAAAELVKTIQAHGAHIDGVGFESHFIVGETPSSTSQMQAMASFTALGMNIHQTEIDVRFSSLPPTASGLAQQASDYYNTVSACMQTEECKGITVWDFDDNYSWVPSTFSGAGDADLYWGNLTRKPAYEAVYQAIEKQSCTVC